MEGSGEDLPLLSIQLDNQLDAVPTTIVQDTVLRDGNFKSNEFRILLICVQTGKIGLDIYAEARATFDQFPSTDLNWHYYYGDYNNIHIRFLPNEAIRITEDILVHYTSYTIYRGLPILSLLLFVVSDWLFWTLLFSSIPLLVYSYRSILRAEHTPYLPFWSPFLRLQPLPLLFTATNLLLAYLQSHNGILIAISALVKLSALLAALTILMFIICSPFIICHRIASRTKSSGYVYIRSARSRLVWVSLFLLLNHALSIPYITWGALSTWKDLSVLFDIDDGFSDWIATNAFVLHISLLPLRALFILISSLFLLPNIRQSFIFHAESYFELNQIIIFLLIFIRILLSSIILVCGLKIPKDFIKTITLGIVIPILLGSFIRLYIELALFANEFQATTGFHLMFVQWTDGLSSIADDYIHFNTITMHILYLHCAKVAYVHDESIIVFPTRMVVSLAQAIPLFLCLLSFVPVTTADSFILRAIRVLNKLYIFFSFVSLTVMISWCIKIIRNELPYDHARHSDLQVRDARSRLAFLLLYLVVPFLILVLFFVNCIFWFITLITGDNPIKAQISNLDSLEVTIKTYNPICIGIITLIFLPSYRRAILIILRCKRIKIEPLPRKEIDLTNMYRYANLEEAMEVA